MSTRILCLRMVLFWNRYFLQFYFQCICCAVFIFAKKNIFFLMKKREISFLQISEIQPEFRLAKEHWLIFCSPVLALRNKSSLGKIYWNTVFLRPLYGIIWVKGKPYSGIFHWEYLCLYKIDWCRQQK